MSDDPYLYPGTLVLKNEFNCRDEVKLDLIESAYVAFRLAQPVPRGDFDLTHLKAIHRHLFQDTYEWAGELRSVYLWNGSHQFIPPNRIETRFAEIHAGLVEANMLRGLSLRRFADEAGRIIGQVNYVHPFREGNGRTQLQFLEQLAEQAGHSLDLKKLDKNRWLEASILSFGGIDYSLMGKEIARIAAPIEHARDRDHDIDLDR